jgi:hypothetical protein
MMQASPGDVENMPEGRRFSHLPIFPSSQLPSFSYMEQHFLFLVFKKLLYFVIVKLQPQAASYKQKAETGNRSLSR